MVGRIERQELPEAIRNLHAREDAERKDRFVKTHKLQITMNGGGGYCLPLDQVGTALEEIQLSIDEESSGEWTIRIIEMTDTELAALPEFEGW